MHIRRLLVAAVLCGCVFALGLNPAPAADPPGTQQVFDQLKKWFHDHCNKDDKTMGKLEAAKAFGYTKPYDYNPKKKDDKKDDDKKDSTSKKDTKQEDKDKLYGNRPDYLFMKKVDTNKDDKVDEKEFDKWAHEYAVQVAKEEQKMTKKPSGSSNRGLSSLLHGAFR